jgi:hypothetical protein
MKTVYLMLLAGIYPGCINCATHATENKDDSVACSVSRVSEKTFNFFASDEPLNMTLRLNLGEFMKTRKQPDFVPAVMQVSFNDRIQDTVDVKIKARGFMRLNYCHFPPMLLKFCDKQALINGQHVKGTMKMVIPCMPYVKFEDYVLKEFLIYKLYNNVTPYSLRTRLIRIRLEDTGKEGKSYDAYGFLIENLEEMAERNHAVVVKNKNLCQRNMETEQMNRVAVFNYMIGNTDWAVPTLHNIKVLKSLDLNSDKGIPVPYDFDYAGLVDAQYAAPATALPIQDVTERFFLGVCENNVSLDTVAEEFVQLKSRILGTIENFPYMNDRNRKSAYTYIDNFYRTYRNEGSLVHTLTRTCKQY